MAAKKPKGKSSTSLSGKQKSPKKPTAKKKEGKGKPG
jgi:hypothetical protein